MKKFYDRKNELKILEQIEKNSYSNAAFTIITGRRRIGKTALLKKFISTKKSCYLFTTRSSEPILCQQWQKELEQSIDLKIFGSITTLKELFEQIIEYSKQEHFILIIDEFQELQNINSSFFSHLQNIWTTAKIIQKSTLLPVGQFIP